MEAVADELKLELELKAELAAALRSVRDEVTPSDVLRGALLSKKGIGTLSRYMNGNVSEIRSTDFATRVLNYMNSCAAVNKRGEEEKEKLSFY